MISQFSLTIDERIYQCKISTEALYMLCHDQDPDQDQLSAYINLKNTLCERVNYFIRNGLSIPDVIKPIHLLPAKIYTE